MSLSKPASLHTSYDATPGPKVDKLLIVYTDVGDDIDDAAALVVALKMLRAGKFDRLIVITAGKGDHVARATYCGLLAREILGYSKSMWTRSLPVLIYEGMEDGPMDCKYLTTGVRAYSESLPTVDNGRERILNEAKQANEVLVLVLAPMGRGMLDLTVPLRDINGGDNNIHFCVMGGAFETIYDGQKMQEAFAEYNVRQNRSYWAEFVAKCVRHTKDKFVLCPLDACGNGSRIINWKQVVEDSPKLFKHAWKHWLKAQKEKGEDNPVLTRIENNNESQLLFDVRALYDGLQLMGWEEGTPEFNLEEILVYPNGLTLMVPRDSEEEVGEPVIVAEKLTQNENGEIFTTGEVMEAVPEQVKVSMQPCDADFRSWTQEWLTKSFAVSKRGREEGSEEGSEETGEEKAAKKSKSE